MRIHTLDLRFQGTPGLIASYLIESSGEFALIETGPGSTLETLRAAIREVGVDEAAIKKVFVTHIHLDHAGAAGWFAQHGATVYCHPNAARHLIDPSKLIDSARMVYGDLMDSLWGDMLPAPAERVVALQDNECVPLGDVEIIAWDMRGITMRLSSETSASRETWRACDWSTATIFPSPPLRRSLIPLPMRALWTVSCQPTSRRSI
ncbi:MAG: MBL fold metallo-hydrolase [Prosthecobacter sp.]|uniref:MBL fold metallo-hydrolase n=1 Tax=Prosthecobacter sp. TaxID=1965333 RepID=UPI0025D13A02|nr:MBL fold metallo-hydrolase [Prosthecobacter sp.]MCF7788237.1 MBL fold metallo-hydrolase [Prosthecobacter sp.]